MGDGWLAMEIMVSLIMYPRGSFMVSRWHFHMILFLRYEGLCHLNTYQMEICSFPSIIPARYSSWVMSWFQLPSRFLPFWAYRLVCLIFVSLEKICSYLSYKSRPRWCVNGPDCGIYELVLSFLVIGESSRNWPGYSTRNWPTLCRETDPRILREES